MPLIETKDGIVLRIPEGMDPMADEVRAAVEQERVGRRRRRLESPEGQHLVKMQQERDRETYDPTEGMGVIDKARANWGAGVASAGQGAKQLLSKVGLAKPVGDEEVLEKRAMDQRLADSTDMGVGADWMPTLGKATQFLGEASPSMAIPASSIGTGGGMLVRALASGAGAGALSGALMPTTSDESKLGNALVGGVFGAAIPAGGAVLKKAYKTLLPKGQRMEAARRLDVTPDTPRPAHPDTMGTPDAENVPLSTAATYGDDRLAGEELASRARGKAHEDWADLDRRQRKEVWSNIEEGTRRSGREAEFREIRSDMWNENTAKAMQQIKPRVWAQEMKNLRTDIDVALRSPQGQNQMRPVLTEIARQMDELGPGFTPQHLAQLRSRMAGSVKGSPMDPFTSAPVSDPAFQSLKAGFDNILNRATGNKWQKVITGYADDSIPVAQAKAETMVKRHFETPEGTPRVKVDDRGVPEVTEMGLKKAITAPEMKNKYGNAPTLADDSGRVLKGTLKALERQNITQSAKKTLTAGGGSVTSPLQQWIAKVDPLGAGEMLGRAYRSVAGFGDRKALEELDQALIDPKRYYELVNEAIEAGKPLTRAQQMAVQAIATSSRALPPRLMEQRQQEVR